MNRVSVRWHLILVSIITTCRALLPHSDKRSSGMQKKNTAPQKEKLNKWSEEREVCRTLRQYIPQEASKEPAWHYIVFCSCWWPKKCVKTQKAKGTHFKKQSCLSTVHLLGSQCWGNWGNGRFLPMVFYPPRSTWHQEGWSLKHFSYRKRNSTSDKGNFSSGFTLINQGNPSHWKQQYFKYSILKKTGQETLKQ